MTYTLKVTFSTDDVQKAALQNVLSCAGPSEQLLLAPDQAVRAQSLAAPSPSLLEACRVGTW